MRLLLIEADSQREAALRGELACHWPAAELRTWSPLLHGAVPVEFLAQSFDAVLLAHQWTSGDGVQWLRELTGRHGFAPIIFLMAKPSERQRRSIVSWGAVDVITTEPLDRAALVAAVARASERQEIAQGDWRVSQAARDSERFGDARIPGFRRVRLLARGSVSQLYIAESRKRGELVALKVTPSRRDESGVDQSFERFLQEYEIAERLHHPNIVRLHELGIADDHAYLSMEYFPLGDLRHAMRHRLSVVEALAFAGQVARVLQAIHGVGILHRDLKPGNVMLRTHSEAALIDFGLAKQLRQDSELTDQGLILGTPHYMSPEQGHGEPIDARTDIYSLGVLLFEMLTGRKPYTAQNPMAVVYMHRKAPIPELPDELHWLQPLLVRLLAKLPADRYASAVQAADAIESACAGLRKAGTERETGDGARSPADSSHVT
jgi:DNA-binding response OmpR family regulator